MTSTASATAGPPRAPRRDAAANDRRVLDAARAVLAERGPDAGMEEIAARAGVGVGTIYRRYESKGALLDAVAAVLAAEMDAAAAEAVDDPDPGRGLRRFLDHVGAFDAEKRRYASLLMDRDTAGSPERTIGRIRELSARAVDAGALPPATTPDDLVALVAAIRAVVGVSPDGDDRTWRRFVEIHLAGLGRVD